MSQIYSQGFGDCFGLWLVLSREQICLGPLLILNLLAYVLWISLVTQGLSQSFHIHGIIAHFLHKGEIGLNQSHLHLVSRIQGNLVLKSDSIARGSPTFIGRIEISCCPKQRFLKCSMLAFEFPCLIDKSSWSRDLLNNRGI